MTIPKKLYKFRKFDVRTLAMLTDHSLYYSDPKKFNDPLDCELSILPDLSPKKLSDLSRSIYGQEREKDWRYEMQSAIHYAEEVGDFKVAGPARDYLIRLLTDVIAREVRKQFDQHGVLAFSERWDSVLMWSHYAEEHRGICIEYDTSELPHDGLRKVRYDGDRSVKASDIYAWQINDDETAGQRAFETHFYSKAPDWHYEEEWREVGAKPGDCEDYRITGIYFGSRCPDPVRVAVVHMLGKGKDVALRDVRVAPDSFRLSSHETDVDEILAIGMREPQGIVMARFIADLDDLDQE